MKKVIGVGFAAILFMISFLVLTAQDTKPVEKQPPSTVVRGHNFIDKNNDGVCDNRGTNQGVKKGKNFIDKNNDGICDNKDKSCKHHHGKKGRGHHDKINK